MNLVMDGRRDGELRVGTRFPKFTAVQDVMGRAVGCWLPLPGPVAV